MNRRTNAALVAAAAGTLSCVGITEAQVVRNGQLVYPQGMPISRATTKIEAEWLRTHPLFPGGFDAVTPPPTGPIHCTAEYEPQEGIIIGWEASTAILAEMAKRITVDAASRVYVSCDSAAIQTSATTTLTSAGCDMSRVTFLIRTLDSVWMCDYGPRYIYEGDCRAVIDHQYNRPRPNDNLFPDYFAQTFKKHAFYQLGDGAGHQLIHGGGNFQLDAQNRGFWTRLIVNENNPPMTGYTYPEASIGATILSYQNLNQTFFNPFPTSVDATQHIDMWMQVVDHNKVIISDWPSNPGSTQDIICDGAAVTMTGMGFTVYRIPAYSVGGVHYTYTNTVMCNNILLMPTYTSGVPTPATTNANALAVFQSALPAGKTAIGINCQSIIPLAGAVHCIVRHIPAHKGLAGPNGGLAPTAYLKSPNGGQSLTPAQQFTISWISDDDAGVSTVDLLLSTDGGATFPITITTGQVPVGSFNWTVPNLNTATARVRAVARDAVNNTGVDASDANFTIGTPPPVCYANCDGSTGSPLLTANDFTCYINAFASGAVYANCDNSSGTPQLTANDFVCFIERFAAGCS